MSEAELHQRPPLYAAALRALNDLSKLHGAAAGDPASTIVVAQRAVDDIDLEIAAIAAKIRDKEREDAARVGLPTPETPVLDGYIELAGEDSSS
ncbi:MAG: hypothetical protein QM581_00485 [Pseudomonas sp.]